jgi:glucose-1-phosphate thymidylyltransferase
MIYYPLSTLIHAGIREIALITRPDEVHLFERLLGAGERFGVSLTYLVQTHPSGIAKAFLIAADFIAEGDDVALALGDNLFYGGAVAQHLAKPMGRDGARIFGYSVTTPQAYGVLEFDDASQPLRVVEKPERPPCHLAVPGLYRFDNSVTERCKELKPSDRGA